MIRELRHIGKGIQDGVFKAVRLVRINSDQTRDVIIPYSRATHAEKECLPRFELIKSELHRGLKSGTYIIECKTGNSNTALVKSFTIIIPNALPEGSGTETHKKEEIIHPEIMQDFIDKDEYLKLIKEITDLRVDKQVLTLRVEFLEQQLKEKNSGLADAATPKSMAEIGVKALEDNLPVVLSIFDKFMSQKDRAMDLKEREISLQESGGSKPVKKKILKTAMPQITKEQVLERMQQLEKEDPASFEATLDEMEKEDPALYDFICNQMGLYEYEEGEESEKQEEE